ncbi:FAD:protein FMN transferase [Microbacterium sp.]|uniref:FAD:protein FMN transferase n=1 Tax=Microbacterium sp. TaxID=51671 RepID=UPI00263922C7|nr:FAD:protein FMN transferase [Microbacterium sp.]
MALWPFDAIGTRWEIETARPLDTHTRARIGDVIDDFDRTWSRFRADSDVSRLARSGGTLRSTDAAPMLAAYREVDAATDGAVNPLVGESLTALGYDADYSFVVGAARPAPRDWAEVATWTDEQLTLTSPAMIDVGALGKGRLVDLVLAELGAVAADVTVDAGGDIAVRGGEARIALEHPFDPSRAIGVATVVDQALCASAINRRVWGDGIHHVLDARTGAPVRTWAATWALAPTAMLADAAATALFFDGGVELAHRWGVEWVRMSTDGRAQRSENCPFELFTAPASRG